MIDRAETLEDLFPPRPGAEIEAELLQQEDERTSVYFIRVKVKVPPEASEASPFESLPYFSTPFEFRDGKVKATFLGNARQIKKHLENLERHARGRYKVVSLMDARFAPNSPIARLTEKQRRVLITAYKLGYYDAPKKIGSEEASPQTQPCEVDLRRAQEEGGASTTNRNAKRTLGRPRGPAV